MDSIIGGVCPWAAGGQAELVLGGFIQLLLASYCGMNSPSMWPKDKSGMFINGTIPEYDFIVVGSGSSGSIVARRLAEENWKVLLLEAGSNPPAESEVPALAMSIQQSMWNWDYNSETSPNSCLAMKDQKCRIPSGRSLGGTSSINNMHYVRGNREDYEEWAKLGNKGWDYESAMKYFQKIEKLEDVPKYEEIKKEYGTDGMMHINSFGGFDPWMDVINMGWKEMNYKMKSHVSEESQVGISEVYGTISAGQRWSAAKGYLTELKEEVQNNLHVIRTAFVTKILIDESTKQATGVQFKLGGKDYDVKMNKEVILAAGSLNTPKVLMLSGIGPKLHLEAVGVKPVIADLPVGKNLIDHVVFPMVIKIENSLGVFSRDQVIQSVMKYLLHRTGPLATLGISDLVGFINSKDDNTKIADVEFLHIHSQINDTLVIPDIIYTNGYGDEYAKVLVEASHDHESLYIMPALLKPKSRGKIELKSADPSERPMLYMNYFNEQEDLDTMLKAVRFVEKMEQTQAFQNAGLKIKEIKLEKCPYEFKTDDYWKCMIKHVASTLYRPVGTARMGPSNDGNYVVDPQLRVFNVKSLRVVDASVMPEITRGSTYATTMMIGEKAADMIKSDWMTTKKTEL